MACLLNVKLLSCKCYFRHVICKYFHTSGINRRDRGFHRVPKKIIEKDGRKISLDELNTKNQSHTFDAPNRNSVRSLQKHSGVLTVNGESLTYERVDEHNDVFSSTMTMLKSRKMREKKNLMLLEGTRLINDAINAGVTIKSVFFSQQETLEGLNLSSLQDVKFYKTFYKELSIWSDLTTNPGIMAVCIKPDMKKLIQQKDSSLPVIVLCDNIREPGNLGAIFRTACAAGVKYIITTTGCVDTWNSKVLRGGAGAHFRIPIYSSIYWPYMRNYLPEMFNVIVADTSNTIENTLHDEACYPRDTETSSEIVVEDTGLIKDDSYADDENLKLYKNVLFPVDYYPNITLSTGKETVLIIGGEVDGISPGALKLAYKFEGKKVNIPLCNGIESLNTAAATAILLFELKNIYEKDSIVQRNKQHKNG